MKPLHSCIFSTTLIWSLSTPLVFAGDGLALMKVEHGARSAGMGATMVVSTFDPNQTLFNPAAAVGADEFTASFGHTAYWENVRLESGFVTIDLAANLVLHSGIRFAAIDEIELRTNASSEPIELFDAHDISYKAGLSYRVTDRIDAGIAAGWFIEKIGAHRGSSFNVDVGIIAYPTDKSTIAASVINLGRDIQLGQQGQLSSRDIALPTTWRAGGSYSYDRFIGVFDLVVLDNDAHAHIGLEGQLHELFQLRTGYMSGYDSKDITAGASFVHRNVRIDYGFLPFSNELGTSHLFNVTFKL